MRRGRTQVTVLPPLPPLEPDDIEAFAASAPAPAPIVPVTTAPPPTPAVSPASKAQVSQTRAPMRVLDLRPLAMWERTAEIASVLARADVRARELLAGSVYPFAAFDRFRRDNPVGAPPGRLPSADGLVVVVDAAVAAPFLLRETLRSLQEQTVGDWRAVIVAPAETRAHPVGSFGDIDPRIAFIGMEAFARPDRQCLLLAAGTALDPHALAWFRFAAARTGAELVYADHDHGTLDPELGALHADPWFFAALDRAALDWSPAPALLWVEPALLAATTAAFDGSDAWRREILRASRGAAAHVPRLLATEIELPIRARGGRETASDGAAGRLGPVAPLLRVPAVVPHDDRIAVVIPIRDGADLLDRAVASLRATARLPGRLDIVVIDNRSTEPATAELLARLEREGAARTHGFDRPFNWGLVNNEGAAASDAPFLVFANNDIEMLSRGWDDVLVDALGADRVGAVGARLLYPNGTVQHGGIVFGMVEGHTEHEGRGIAATDPGPNRRLVTPRTVGAVTGAFLGLARETFDAVGGIDTTMGVAHSDFDLCFRLRERGLTIRYEPRIEAIHFESVTRGFNSSKAEVAWDESERYDLLRRWGTATLEDVGVNPSWARSGAPFDALREPSLVEVVRHIDRTGRVEPWRPTRAAEQGDAEWRAEALG